MNNTKVKGTYISSYDGSPRTIEFDFKNIELKKDTGKEKVILYENLKHFN